MRTVLSMTHSIEPDEVTNVLGHNGSPLRLRPGEDRDVRPFPQVQPFLDGYDIVSTLAQLHRYRRWYISSSSNLTRARC